MHFIESEGMDGFCKNSDVLRARLWPKSRTFLLSSQAESYASSSLYGCAVKKTRCRIGVKIILNISVFFIVAKGETV
jgi:hypothetical protein